MSDAAEMIITTLAVVLAGTVFAIGGGATLQALRRAVRAGPAPGQPAADRPQRPRQTAT